MTVITAGDEMARDEEFLVWLRDHGVEPKDTYRVELDYYNMSVFQYARNADGAFHLADGQIATREPFNVGLKRPLDAR